MYEPVLITTIVALFICRNNVQLFLGAKKWEWNGSYIVFCFFFGGIFHENGDSEVFLLKKKNRHTQSLLLGNMFL